MRIFGGRWALAALGLLVGCGDDEDDGAPPPTGEPAAAAEVVQASVEQGRPFVARDLLEVLLRNGSDERLELRALRLVDDRFEPVAATARDVLLLAGHGPTSMPITYGAAVCEVASDAGDPAVELVRVDGSTLLVAVDASGDDFLAQLHGIECARRRVEEIVELSWGPPFTRVSDTVVELTLHVERRTAGDAVTIHDLGGTVVFAQRLPDPGAVPATLGPDDDALTIPVELSTERCEAHALTESNKTYRFNVWVAVGDEPSVLVEVLPDGEARALLDEAMQAGCFGTLD